MISNCPCGGKFIYFEMHWWRLYFCDKCKCTHKLFDKQVTQFKLFVFKYKFKLAKLRVNAYYFIKRILKLPQKKR